MYEYQCRWLDLTEYCAESKLACLHDIKAMPVMVASSHALKADIIDARVSKILCKYRMTVHQDQEQRGEEALP